MTEWLMVPLSKSGIPRKRDRGFESLSLRQYLLQKKAFGYILRIVTTKSWIRMPEAHLQAAVRRGGVAGRALRREDL